MWGDANKKARVRWKILTKSIPEGGTGLKDHIIILDASKIKMLQKSITRDRQPWMRWIERKLIRVADIWEVEEAMAATPTKKQRKQLKDTCLTGSTLSIWIEIGGQKRDTRYVDVQPKPNEEDQRVKQTWKSGFGIDTDEKWVPIEKLTTQIVYTILLTKRNKLKNYIPNIAHKTIFKIQQYLTPEERHYWWRLNHNLISINKIENKYKRYKEGNIVPPNCPICNNPEETRDHYNYDCPSISTFRQNIALSIGKTELARNECNLKEQDANTSVNMLIAKARWVFHCERCNVDHNRNKRINHHIILQRAQQRMKLAETVYNKTKTHNNNNTTITNQLKTNT